MLKRNAKLVNKKFIEYLIPSIITMFAMSFGSLLDGILIGNFLGNDALSATSMVLPILYIIQMPGLALGVGGTVVVGALLGKRETEKASKAYSACMFYGILISVILAILGPFISRPLASLFAPSLIEDSYDYLLIYLVTDPIITIALLIASFMIVDNNPKLSSVFYILANIFKVGLQVLFILVFKWRMIGAALSTAAGYLFAMVVVIFYLKSKNKMLHFTFKIKGTFNDFKSSLKASGSVSINLILTAVQMFVINIFVGKVIVDSNELQVFGVIMNMVFVFDLFCGGVVGLVPTIVSIFYGEKDYYSLKSLVKKIYLINLGITLAIGAFIFIFPSLYASIFGYSNDDLTLVNFITRIYLFSFIGYEINKFSVNYYPSIEKNTPSYITVLLRELIVVLPVTLILLYKKGLEGYAIAQIINETCAVIGTYIFILIYNMKSKKYKGIFMFETLDLVTYDISIPNEMEYASKVSQELETFALENGVSKRDSSMIALSSEEMIANIIAYGYKRKNSKSFIDLNLKISDDKLVLRIRDNGLPFDPTTYVEEEKGFSTSGITLIKKITNKMTYMRILNLNNTIMEINKGEIINGN